MDFQGKRVLVVGLARSGMAAIKVLSTLGATITLSESKKKEDIKELDTLLDLGVTIVDQSIEVACGDYDLCVKNPGVHNDIPFMVKLYERGVPVITEIELAFQVAQPQHFIAITGTNGKTTTSTLVHEILSRKYGSKAHLCGNIGIPLCEIVMNENLLNESGHYITLEISNYQLVNIDKFHPDVATIINLTPDHIDVHGSLDAYYKSKTEVYRNMTADDTFILNSDDETLLSYVDKYPVPATVKTISLNREDADATIRDGQMIIDGDVVLDLKSIRLPGRHNLQNVIIAVSCCKAIGVENSFIKEAVEAFTGVEHRIEFVRELNGVRYYNDSKGTNTDATVTALKAFDRGVILLIGGFEKGLPMDDVKAHLGCVKKVIGFGACGERLVCDTVGDDGIVVTDLKEAVDEAVKIAEAGDTVLLSPTTSSFDQYSCFEERGDHFKELVNAL
ncbi:MAG: UDP-N-acetylmuramoyl-L-alanine--D-glutamate ligase [Clostridia bacterium]|nr:UDP-N-acetylmuramoyl-L-alanine--D-glutamate ligase [Clostridia bacterium]